MEELSTALRLGVVRNSPMLIPEFAWEAMPSPRRRTITRGLRNGKRAAITAGAIGSRDCDYRTHSDFCQEQHWHST